jgi:nitroreductase
MGLRACFRIRTIRDFLPDPLPQETLDRCLDAARLAPSSSNLQPREFMIIRDPELRQAAATFMLAMRAEGFDTCPMEGFDPWRAKALLGLP